MHNLRKLIQQILNENFGEDILSGINDIELSDDDKYEAKTQIINNYLDKGAGTNYNAHRRYLSKDWYEYWLPIEAKKDLDYIGYNHYTIERATNKQHPDYKKTFVVFAHGEI